MHLVRLSSRAKGATVLILFGLSVVSILVQLKDSRFPVGAISRQLGYPTAAVGVARQPSIAESPANIVRIIHQSWKTTELPSARMKRWSESWRRCYPDWRFVLWTDEANRQLIAKHYPWFLARYDEMPLNILRVDVVRYFYMLHYGGIYADLDTECVRPFEHLLNTSTVFGAMDGQWDVVSEVGYVQNSFMYSRPGHPFWLELIMKVMLLPVYKFGQMSVESATGPRALFETLNSYMKRGKTDFIVYPGKYFNPFSWIKNKNSDCIIKGMMTEENYSRCKASFKDAYVIQYHTKVWDNGKA